MILPEYDDVTFDNDFSLLRLASPATGHTPIAVNTQGSVPVAQESVGTIMGWGSGSDLILHEGLVPFPLHSDCVESWAEVGDITESLLCAGYGAEEFSSGATVCPGDSGSPLVIYAGGEP